MLGVNRDIIEGWESSTQNTIEWRDIPGYEGSYQASSDGRIRSLDRTSVRPDGVVRNIKGKELKRCRSGGYLNVNLSLNGVVRQVTVHKLVLLAFVGPLPEGMERLHGLGGAYDNSIENLRYGTRADNNRDKAKHRAVKRKVGQTCSRGHDISESPTWGSGNRICMECREGKPAARQVIPEWI